MANTDSITQTPIRHFQTKPAKTKQADKQTNKQLREWFAYNIEPLNRKKNQIYS